MSLEDLFSKYGKVYNKQKIICHENNPATNMYLILEGKVLVYKQGSPPDCRRIDIAYLESGDFFGEMSLLEGMPRSASIRALTEVRVLDIDLKVLKKIFKIQPSLSIRMFKKFSERLRKSECWL